MKGKHILILGFGFMLGTMTVFSVIGFFHPRVRPIASAEAAQNSSKEIYASAIEVQGVFRRVSAEILPSVVEISTASEKTVGRKDSEDVPWKDFFSDPTEESGEPRLFRSRGLGSGVIVKRDGSTYYVVTNGHVIGGSSDIFVLLKKGPKRRAELVGHDKRKDIALVKFESSDKDFPVVRLGDSDKLYVGDWVLAFGTPFGYEQSVSSGIVSALGRYNGPDNNISDFIQTDAAINQGNSGGALVNIKGEVVGITTFITTPNRGSAGLAFAIPINNIKSTVKQLMETGQVQYGWLGVSLGPYGSEAAASMEYPEDGGVMVYQIFEGSPAQKAGLKPGDLIESVDGEDIITDKRLMYMIGEKQPGESVSFRINRFGREQTVKVKMGVREEEENVRTFHDRALPGFVPAPLTKDLRTLMKLPENIIGVPVAEVYPKSPAQLIDLRAGDLILEINGQPIDGLKSLYLNLSEDLENYPEFLVYREGERLSLK